MAGYQVRVGRRIGNKDPSFPGFKNILCLTRSTPYGDLGPYSLFDQDGRNIENLWQFAKVYEQVPESTQRYSRFNQTIIWDWPAEEHITTSPPKDRAGYVRISGTKKYLTPAYFAWRKAGMEAQYAIRYPVGFKARSQCIGSLTEAELEAYYSDPKKKSVKLIDYIEARKQIYVPLYTELVQKVPKFKLLKKMAKKQNLLIIEVDGPHQEGLEYYQENYGVDDDFIENNTMLVTKENLRIMRNDPKFAYGHGYVLSSLLI
jgi:hypothetical protein